MKKDNFGTILLFGMNLRHFTDAGSNLRHNTFAVVTLLRCSIVVIKVKTLAFNVINSIPNLFTSTFMAKADYRLFFRLTIALLAVIIISGCSATKYVPDDELLLNRVVIDGDLGHCNSDELMDYVRQRPNVRVLGFWRVNLNLYNLSRHKDNWFNNWLRRIGTPPVLYDSAMVSRSSDNIRLYLESCGYYDSKVSDTTIITGKKKCKVIYDIDTGTRYRISSIDYNIEDDSLRDMVLTDTVNSLLRKGSPFDTNTHDKERERISRRINDMGYYHFNKDYIYFIADSSYKRHWVADSLILLSYRTNDIPAKVESHRKSIVKEIVFVINKAGLTPLNTDSSQMDTLHFNDYMIVHQPPLIFNPELLTSSCLVTPGSFYSVSDIEQTQMRFNNLKLFNAVSARYDELPGIDSLGNRQLRCTINLTVGTPQSYAIDIEGTNSSGNLGGAANLRYSHSNLLHGAEVFSIKYRIASQTQFAREGKERFNTFETGAEITLNLPKFFAPWGNRLFAKRIAPSTLLSLSYDFQRRPDFTKSVISTKFGYTWRQTQNSTHSLTPLEINIINIPKISDEFVNYIKGSYLQHSYTNHFIVSLGYSYLYNQKENPDNAWYFRFDIETAGNTLSLFTNNIKANEDNIKEIWGISYAQYVKSNAELRYQISDFWHNNFVYRLYAGIGVPYGNSQVLPFEKSYFVGGANSIRAWPVRGLGPGSSQTEQNLRYHNQTSDIRLELNAEYRFKIVSPIEGAIFADAGNIWALPKTTDNKDAHFNKEFYKQLAFGSGVGLRLNFNYFVIRLDAAVKLHDPSKQKGERWVIATQPFKASDINYNFAIGYPF